MSNTAHARKNQQLFNERVLDSSWTYLSLKIHQIFLLVRDWSKRVTWPNISQLKLGNIRGYSPIFKTARVAKKIWRIIKTIVAIWGENMLGYLSADMICSEKRTVFRERSSRKTVNYEEQTMSKDKYPRIFSPQMDAIVFIILQIVFATRVVLKIGEYPRIFPSFSWEIFGHVTRLDQSRASEKIWWIINRNSNWTEWSGI